MRRPEEYVHITLDRYEGLKAKERKLEEAKYKLEIEDIIYKKITNEKEELKKALMSFTIDKHMVKHYSMEEITNPDSWKFAFEDVKPELIEVGITIEEMVEFTRTYKAQYEAEEAAQAQEKQDEEELG